MVCPGKPPAVMVAVLVDDPALRDLVAEILEDAGYRAWSLPADPDGLATLRATPPGVVLLEVWWGAPDRGIALLRRLRADPLTPAVPVVALGTHADVPERRTFYRDAGCAAVVPAPFELDELLATVAAVLAPARPDAGPTG